MVGSSLGPLSFHPSHFRLSSIDARLTIQLRLQKSFEGDAYL